MIQHRITMTWYPLCVYFYMSHIFPTNISNIKTASNIFPECVCMQEREPHTPRHLKDHKHQSWENHSIRLILYGDGPGCFTHSILGFNSPAACGNPCGNRSNEMSVSVHFLNWTCAVCLTVGAMWQIRHSWCVVQQHSWGGIHVSHNGDRELFTAQCCSSRKESEAHIRPINTTMISTLTCQSDNAWVCTCFRVCYQEGNHSNDLNKPSATSICTSNRIVKNSILPTSDNVSTQLYCISSN